MLRVFFGRWLALDRKLLFKRQVLLMHIPAGRDIVRKFKQHRLGIAEDRPLDLADD